MKPRRAQRQGGYALLFVFALAAALAYKLYLEMPRVAFEAQRNKEDMLVERGEQYIRGIQLFVRKMGRYPQTIDELEKTNNVRFLRRRYKDPMTGKDEWRIVHVDASGALTDSLVHKRGQPGDDKTKAPSVLANTIQGIGASAEVITPGGGAQPAAALQRRASDRIIPGGMPGGAESGEDPNNPSERNPSTPESRSGPDDPNAPPPPPGSSPFQQVPISGFPPGMQPGYPPGYPPGFQHGNQPGMPPGYPPGVNPDGSVTRYQQPGMGVYPNPPVNSQAGGMIGVPIGGMLTQPPAPPTSRSGGGFGSGSFGGGSFVGGQAGGGPLGGIVGAQPGYPQNPNFPGQMGGLRPGIPPGMPGSNQNPALQMINQILTGQRQNPAQRAAAGVGGQNLGGGIAGVASTKDAEGIKIYKERTNYKEWEFLYDPKEDAMNQAAKQGAPGAAGNQPGSQNPPGFPGVPNPNQPMQPGMQPIAPKPASPFGFGRQ